MDLHWRNTQKSARFFALDARSICPIVLVLVHFRIWTCVLAVIAVFVFWFLERRGLTFEASLRAFRCWFLGVRRPANHRRSIRRWIDYG